MTSVVSAIADAVPAGIAAVKSSVAGGPSRKAERSSISLTAPTANNIGQVRKLNSVLFPVRYSDKWYKDILKPDNLELSRIGLYNDIPVGVLAARYEQAHPAHAPEVGGVNIYLMILGVLAPYRRRGLASALLKHLLAVVRPGGETPEIGGADVVVPFPGESSAPQPASELPPPATPTSARTPSSSSTSASDTTSKDGKANGSKGGKAALPASSSTSSISNSRATSPPPAKRFHYRVQAIYLHVQTSNGEARAFYESHGFVVAREIKEYYRKGVEPQSAWLLELRA